MRGDNAHIGAVVKEQPGTIHVPIFARIEKSGPVIIVRVIHCSMALQQESRAICMTRFTSSRKSSLIKDVSTDEIHDDSAFDKQAPNCIEVAILASFIKRNLHERRGVRCPHSCLKGCAIARMESF